MSQARAAAAVAMRDQGVDIRHSQVVITCQPSPGNCLAPESVISVDVGYPVALPLIPELLGGNRPSIRVEAKHSVPYGTFREDR